MRELEMKGKKTKIPETGGYGRENRGIHRHDVIRKTPHG